SITGLIDLKMLYFLNIVNSYILNCELPLDFKDSQKLKQISLIIQNLEKSICSYKFNDLIKFNNIVGCENCKQGLNNNPTIVFNTPPVISDPNEIPSTEECPILCNPIIINYDAGLLFVKLFH